MRSTITCIVLIPPMPRAQTCATVDTCPVSSCALTTDLLIVPDPPEAAAVLLQ